MQFLEPAGHLDRPAVVAEVPANLTHDGRHRKRHEIRPGVDIEPDHRVDQSHAGHLHQIIAGFAASVEPAGDVVGQRQASLHDPVTLALKLRRGVGQIFELAEHVSDVRVFRVRS
jgi:hypothetical protein